MPKFKVKIEETKESLDFIKDTQERLKTHNILRNPFIGEIQYKDNIIYIDLTPIYPNLSWLGLVLAIPIFIFGLPYFLLIATFPFILIWFLRTKAFFYLVVRSGLRKYNYKGKIKYLMK